MNPIAEDVTAVAQPSSKLRRQLMLAAQLLVTAGLLYVAFRGVDVETALDRIWRMPLAAVLLCFLVSAVQMLVLAYRWHLLLAAFKCRAAPLTLMRGVLAERFVNQLLPSTVGGDSARFVTLIGDDISRGTAFLSVLFDRISGTLCIILLGGIIAPLGLIYGFGPRIALMPALFAAAAAIAVLAAAVMPRQVVLRIAKLFRSQHFHQLADSGHQLVRSGQFYQATCIVSVVIHALSCAVFVLIAAALLGYASIGAVAVCAPIILVATAIPITAGGWGMRESVSVALLQVVGITAADALGIAILFGIVQLLTGVLAGLVLLVLQIGDSLSRDWLLQPEQWGDDGSA
jgi:uncharacterized membrane protein YbhN (UPF0104 family)